MFSSLHTGRETRVYRALFSGTVTALVNDEIISEYRDVLHRPKFGFNAEDIDKDIAFIEQSGVKIHPGDSTADFPDPDDKVFFCTACGRCSPCHGQHETLPQGRFYRNPRAVL